jgi:uncharacterized protein
MTELQQPNWTRKPLAGMTPEEWEILCDGCGRCCLFKLEDEDSGEIFFTNVACRLLDSDTCRCMDYEYRFQLVPGCVKLTQQNIYDFNWLPDTCAYRRLIFEKPLEWWHPLISESPHTVHDVGISMRGKIIAEEEADLDQLEQYVISWDNQTDE